MNLAPTGINVQTTAETQRAAVAIASFFQALTARLKQIEEFYRRIQNGMAALNNAVLNLECPSVGAAIETANDYTLVTVGSISSTPVLAWITAPVDTTGYSLVTSANSIKLHFSGVAAQQRVPYASKGGGNLTLTWDTGASPGCLLRGQTNSTGIGTGWGTASGGRASPFLVAIDPANPSVFFHLFKP